MVTALAPRLSHALSVLVPVTASNETKRRNTSILQNIDGTIKTSLCVAVFLIQHESINHASSLSTFADLKRQQH